VAQLGRNADGEILEPGRVPDCYLGLRLDTSDTEATGVLVFAPTALLHPLVPQPDGTVLYELVTGHPDRARHELCRWSSARSCSALTSPTVASWLLASNRTSWRTRLLNAVLCASIDHSRSF
jgi:hypothetical protein